MPIPPQAPRSPRRPPGPGLLLAAILWAGAPLTGCGAEGSRAAMPLACQQDTVDFGPTWEGTILEHSFEIEVGAQALRILETETDCGCTLTQVQGPEGPYELGSVLSPGTRLELDVQVNTRGKRGRAPRKVHLIYQVGAGAAVRMPLTIFADVRPWLVSEPPITPLLITSEGEAIETSFLVRQADGEAFALTPSSEGLPPWIQVEVEGGVATQHHVKVRFGEAAPRGVRGYAVRLEADQRNPMGFTDPETGERPFFSLFQEVSVDVRGPVGLRPASLSFGVVRPGQIVSRSVRVESHDPAFVLSEPRARLSPLKLDEPFHLGDCASIRTRSAGDGAWDVEVTLAGLGPEVRGNFFARLVIETGHPELPELEASLLGVALGAAGAPRAPSPEDGR